ncbi:hypothetical protein NDU88_004486 [Pleurodeles waltl]|uniref:Uncharacterized protein n=1 Tax=Pleurodeles waltl TaxID=8319 RepID=A0AAV7VJF6_PLEWA|nr:hypothetical protein NDU88_004486 [Pleurodeles waltl]
MHGSRALPAEHTIGVPSVGPAAERTQRDCSAALLNQQAVVGPLCGGRVLLEHDGRPGRPDTRVLGRSTNTTGSIGALSGDSWMYVPPAKRTGTASARSERTSPPRFYTRSILTREDGVLTGTRVRCTQSGGKGFMCVHGRGVRRTLVRDLQKNEVELREVECGVATGTVDLGKLGELRGNWDEVDLRLRQFDYRHYIARMHSEVDRYSRLLAWLIKGKQQHTPIGAIRLESGVIVNTQLEMNEAFKQYYSALYMARPPPSPGQLEDFFEALTAQQVLDLEKPIEMEEIQQALRQQAHNKAPGSYCLPAEYYQAFSAQTFNHIWKC